MSNKTILNLYERLEALVAKLPAALQKPILQEMTPVKNLFLRQRSPRIVIAGEAGACREQLLNALFNTGISQPDSSLPFASGWHEFSCGNRGAIRLLDARASSAAEASIKSALV
ncbi:MAG: hypothetical protein WCD79_10370, partial [Chthoniobacteraceae bacterium]